GASRDTTAAGCCRNAFGARRISLLRAARLCRRPRRIGDCAASVTQRSASLRTHRLHSAAARPAGGRSAEPAARGGAGPAQLLYSATNRAQLPIPAALCRGGRCLGLRVSDRPDNAETRANRGLWYMCWKADTRPLRQTIDAILTQGSGAIASAADIWFFCTLADRDAAAAERALVALGDNPCWNESTINLSRSFGEGLQARMTKEEARVRTAFEASSAKQEKIVQEQPDYGPELCVLV